jgi:hypothetical protein
MNDANDVNVENPISEYLPPQLCTNKHYLIGAGFASGETLKTQGRLQHDITFDGDQASDRVEPDFQRAS